MNEMVIGGMKPSFFHLFSLVAMVYSNHKRLDVLSGTAREYDGFWLEVLKAGLSGFANDVWFSPESPRCVMWQIFFLLLM